MTVSAPPGWYVDPFRRFQHRYWDGVQWTQHVATAGRQAVDAPGATPGPSVPATGSRKIRRQVRQAGVEAGGHVGGGTLFTEPVLVVNQVPKVLEVSAEYAVHDQYGRRLGAVREVGQSLLKRAVMGRPSARGTKRLVVVDGAGRDVLSLTRPRAVARSTVTVRRPDGSPVGQIAQRTLGVLKAVTFDFEVGGQVIGSLVDEGGWDYRIEDATGEEVARVVKSLSGVSRRQSTKRDKYVVQIHRPLAEPMVSLVVATALVIDTVFRQRKTSRRF